MNYKRLNILLFLVLLSQIACSSRQVVVTPPEGSVLVGATFYIDISIYSVRFSYELPHRPWDMLLETESAYSPVKDLYGVAFDLWYDPAIISFQSIDISSGFLSSAQTATAFRNSQLGKLVVGLSLEGGVNGMDGMGTIARIYFRGESAGITTVEVKDLTTFDSAGNRIPASAVLNYNQVVVE